MMTMSLQLRSPGPRALIALLGLCALTACGDGSPTNPAPGDATVAEPSVEARALWLSRYDYGTQAELVALIDSAAAAHFNIVYFQARGSGDAWYAPGLEPWGRLLAGLGVNPGWDPLAVAVDRAHARGLELHAWLNVTPGWVEDANHQPLPMPTTTPPHQFLVHPDWIYKTPAGQRLADGASELFTPAAAGYRAWVARVAADVARRYAVDGIHLDYIRYPYATSDWSDSLSLAQWRALPFPGDFDDYRRSLIPDIVRQVGDSLRAVRPAARLSAAVWGVYRRVPGWNNAGGYEDRLQPARDWAAQGIIDALVPMVYWHIAPGYGGRLDFAYLADDHVQAVTNRHVYIGLDIENDSLVSNGSQMVKEINRARFAGAPGVSVFSAQILRRNDWWHILPQTVFRKKATVPSMSWK